MTLFPSYRSVSARKRLRFLQFAGCLAVFLGAIAAKVWNDHQDARIIARYNTDRRVLVDNIWNSEAGTLEKMVEDYSVWSDLQNYVKSPNEAWIRDNADTAIESYGLSELWILDGQGRIVHEATDGRKLPTAWSPVADRRDLPRATDRVRYFQWTDSGLQDFLVGRFHREDGNSPESSGYIVVAKDMDQARLESLSKALDSQVTILKPGESGGRNQDVTASVYDVPLKGPDGKPVAWLHVFRPSMLASRVLERGNMDLAQQGIGLGFLVTTLLIVFRRFVVLPKAEFERAVERGDAYLLADYAGHDDGVDGVVALLESNARQTQLQERNADLRKLVEERTRGLQAAGEESLNYLVELLEHRSDALPPKQVQVLGTCEAFAASLGLDNVQRAALRKGLYLRFHRDTEGRETMAWLDNSLFARSVTLGPILSVCLQSDIPWKTGASTATIQSNIFAVVSTWFRELESHSKDSHRSALAALRIQAGTRLDPRLVEKFVEFLGHSEQTASRGVA